ncbi:ankyrin repeat domain-containing protein [Leptospira fletcheri]|uniref:Ankyrin repeat domain-containing protein n=1 Tax=Leptospira fletcheri TaxID=2484981 RepID=A0A4R9GGS3_9LEPT|nr:ankyrin repeat domain-containing protein [Leptospira fletcheri]TGK11878.1 ankyrin repeat domain-containing protein [Leptospira fletcheri]
MIKFFDFLFLPHKGSKNRIFFCSIPLLSFLFLSGISAGENTLPKIYIHKFKTEQGVPASFEIRLRNGIINSILRNFEGKYNIADDDSIATLLRQAELKQKQNCSDEICMTQIADAVDADILVSGEISNTSNGFKVYLRSQNRDPKLLTYMIKTNFDFEFREFQVDYYAGEAGRKLVDLHYSMNISSLSSVNPDAVDIPSLKIESAQGSNINVLDFKTSDGGAQGFIEAAAAALEAAELASKNKNYERSISIYENVLSTMEDRLSEKSKTGIKEYMRGIRSRIANAYLIIYKNRLEVIDSQFKSGNAIPSVSLRNFLDKYREIQNEYHSKTKQEYRIRDLEKAMGERVEKFDIAVLNGIEKEGDSFYSKFDFTNATLSYRSVRAELTAKRPDTIAYRNLKSRIEKKISASETTGRSYLQSKLAGIFQSLEKDYVSEGLETEEKAKNKHFDRIKDGLRQGLETLVRSDFSSEDLVRNYNILKHKADLYAGRNLFDQNRADELLQEGIDRKFQKQIDTCIKLGADPNSRGSSSNSAVERLIENKQILISPDAVKIARKQIQSNNQADTDLFNSVFQRKPDDIIRNVLKGADPNAKDILDNTPLHKATGYGYPDISALLLMLGADVNSKNSDGETPLHRSVGQGSLEVSKLLLSVGSDVNAIKNDGETPIYRAVNAPKMAKLLLETGANVNLKNYDGWTPLHKVAESGSPEVAKLLLQAGANVNAKDNSGWTPLDWAVQKNRFENPNVVKILRSAGGQCLVNCVE